MAFHYEQHKNHQDSGSFWTSYSDLFLGMSVIFLLLYVTTSLRTGTDGYRAAMENRRLTQKVEDLENQLKTYDSIRKSYLQSEASKDETQIYNELMDKLTLLKEETKEEKLKLRRAANDNAKKEEALNQYQQMIRNVINANVMAKTKIRTREQVITDQDAEITGQAQEINDLKVDVAKKQDAIDDAENKLKEQLAQLKASYKAHRVTQAVYENKVKALKAQSESTIASLEGQIETTENEIKRKSAELNATKNLLATTEVQKQALAGEKAALLGEKTALEEKTAALAGERAALQGRNAALAGERAALQGKNAALQGENASLQGANESLQGDIESLQGKNAALRAQKQFLEGEKSALGGKLKDTEGLLAKAQAERDARRRIAKDIIDSFQKAGVNAKVDPMTGEVEINFGDSYFDNDSARLKDQMKEILRRAMPAYSKSLLGDPKLAKKISSVEIIGFASPTFQGKYVDPNNLSPEGRRAVDYNLDLSYQRAKSMFQFVFDERNLKFNYQKELLPLIKVTGRSFLAESISRNPADTGNDFCETHDCRRAQRVLIRFNVDEKQ
ncbi:MAG: microtubule-binding protein [Bdellovibrio sp.]|nr:MAG: microtubule-binding protein [Bdellovibrio sp.]